MIRIATRGSALALWQARSVAATLDAETGEACELVVLETRGDKILDQPLTPDLGKSFFTKEIEDALLDGRADLAVHSLKDLAVDEPDGLVLCTVPERAAPGERLLIRGERVDEAQGPIPLPEGAIVGTSSPRRRKRLAALREDLVLTDLRGNVPTRVQKLRDGAYDAILLACAGLDRLELDMSGLCRVDLPVELFPGAPGQGALGLQTRADDERARGIVARLAHEPSETATRVERALLGALGGGCSLPLGAYCEARDAGGLVLHAFLFDPERDTPQISVRLEGKAETDLVAEAARRLRPALTRPLEGRSVLVLGGPDRGRIDAELEAAGAMPRRVPCFDFEAVELGADALDAIAAADHLAIASVQAARRLAARGVELATDAVLLAPGEASVIALREAFPRHRTLVGNPPNQEGMARLALERGAVRLVALGAEDGQRAGVDIAASLGVDARQIPLYRSRPFESVEVEALETDDLAVYLSPAAARACPPDRLGTKATLCAIGMRTAHEVAELGSPALAVAPTPDLDGILIALAAEGES